jgi:hypothetical protein
MENSIRFVFGNAILSRKIVLFVFHCYLGQKAGILRITELKLFKEKLVAKEKFKVVIHCILKSIS